MSIAPALLCIALILGCSATDVEIENGNINQSSDAVELNDEESYFSFFIFTYH